MTAVIQNIEADGLKRTYGEIDELFERRVVAWRFKETVTSVQEQATLARANA